MESNLAVNMQHNYITKYYFFSIVLTQNTCFSGKCNPNVSCFKDQTGKRKQSGFPAPDGYNKTRNTAQQGGGLEQK